MPATLIASRSIDVHAVIAYTTDPSNAGKTAAVAIN
jgi:hypothetical protein